MNARRIAEIAKANNANKLRIARKRARFAHQTANLNKFRHSGNLNKPYKYG